MSRAWSVRQSDPEEGEFPFRRPQTEPGVQVDDMDCSDSVDRDLWDVRPGVSTGSLYLSTVLTIYLIIQLGKQYVIKS